MFIPIFLGFTLGTLSMVIHALGTIWWLQHERHRHLRVDAHSGVSTLLGVLGGTLIVLTTLHVVQIALWAVAFLWIPDVMQLASLEEALYFSLVTFTTVGYGDVVIDKGWRIMAGIEALNGILLIGWSTAVLLSVAQRFWRTTSVATSDDVPDDISGK